MLTIIGGLDPAAHAALAGVLAGVVLWAVQRWWTDCPWLPLLGASDTVRRKRLAAVLASLLPGIAAGLKSHDWQAGAAVGLSALLASQTVHLWTRGQARDARGRFCKDPDAVGIKDAEEAA